MTADLHRYLDLYVTESREHLGAAAGLIGDGSDTARTELYRHLHSLKGMAAAMGFAPIVTLYR